MMMKNLNNKKYVFILLALCFVACGNPTISNTEAVKESAEESTKEAKKPPKDQIKTSEQKQHQPKKNKPPTTLNNNNQEPHADITYKNNKLYITIEELQKHLAKKIALLSKLPKAQGAQEAQNSNIEGLEGFGTIDTAAIITLYSQIKKNIKKLRSEEEEDLATTLAIFHLEKAGILFDPLYDEINSLIKNSTPDYPLSHFRQVLKKGAKHKHYFLVGITSSESPLKDFIWTMSIRHTSMHIHHLKSSSNLDFKASVIARVNALSPEKRTRLEALAQEITELLTMVSLKLKLEELNRKDQNTSEEKEQAEQALWTMIQAAPAKYSWE